MNNFERFIIGDCTIIRHTNFTFRAVFGRDNIIRKTKNSSFKNEKSKKEVDVTITVSNKDIV